jgi:hypothetical protein
VTEQLEVTKRLASFVALKRDRSGLQRWNAQIIPGARGVRHAGLKTRAPSIHLGDKYILNSQGEDGEPYRRSSRIRKLLVLIGTGVLTLGARVFRPAWFPVRVLVVSELLTHLKGAVISKSAVEFDRRLLIRQKILIFYPIVTGSVL